MRPTLASAARRRRLCTTAAAVAMIVVMSARAEGPTDDADEPAPAAPGDVHDPSGDADETHDPTGDADETHDPTGDAGSDAGPGPGTLAAAVSATRALHSARVELSTTLVGPSGPVVLTHRAAFVDGGLRASAESDMSQVAEALGAAGQGLEGDWSQPARVVIEAGTVYSQLGPMAEALGREPTDWSRAELADLVGSGAVADNDALALALDPLGPLDLLRRPVVEVGDVAPGDAGEHEGPDERSGEGGGAARGEAARGEAARGGAARHLRASLDLVGGPDGAPAEGTFESRLVAAGIEALPVDVWIDGAGVVRRMVVAVDIAGSPTTTFEVFDVDAVAEGDVAAPDPAEVLDADDLRGGAPSPGNGSAG